MILSTIRMAIPLEKQNDALRVIGPIIAQSRKEPGCLSYHVYQDIMDNNVLMIQGNWKTEKNLEQHVRSHQYINLLLVMEMSLKQPEIRFDTIAGSIGIEKINMIRSDTHEG